MYRKFVLAIVMSAISCSTFALTISKKEPDLSAKLSLVHEKITLPNGLSVILSEDHTSPFVAVNIWYRVGAVDERIGRTGFAHLFEHQMFGGTRHVKSGDHFKLLDAGGAFDLNASTHFERTNYYQTVPNNKLELALALESSRMFWLAIDQKQLTAQKAVVRREREQRSEATPYGLATLKLWEAIFPPKHPFHGQVIGSHKDIEAATLVDVQQFYDKHYGPANATLTLVGDFKKEDAMQLINKYFSTLPKLTPAKAPVLPTIALKDEEIIRVEEKLGKLTLLHYQYLTPALYTPGDADLDLIGHILSGGQYGRLTTALTRNKPLATSVNAYQQSFGALSVFTIDVLLNPGVDEAVARQEVDKVLGELSQKPVSQTEIDRARNYILTQQLFNLQNLGGYMGRAELLQTYNFFANKPDFLKEDMQRYQKVDVKSLQDAAAKYLPVGKARKILIAQPTSVSVAHKGN